MNPPMNHSNIPNVIELISKKGFEGMAEVMQLLVNEAMRLERRNHLQAEPYQRTEERKGYANGFKNKTLNTRMGTLPLSVPQVRDGDFYPSFLEKGLRSERALKIALAEMYVQGVSTRKVTRILEELCGLQVSRSDVSRASALLDEELGR
jgi:putative transposase